jgi:N-methylhydantoinase B/oxoprolinase/acetone carboxylase alpha subunit
MNNNYNGNYNMNQSNYTSIDELTHIQALRRIAQRRAEFVYKYEMEQYEKAMADKQQRDNEAVLASILNP